MKCHMHGESCSLDLNVILWVTLSVSYLMTTAPAAGTLACTEGVEPVFVWGQKLCSHWTYR